MGYNGEAEWPVHFLQARLTDGRVEGKNRRGKEREQDGGDVLSRVTEWVNWCIEVTTRTQLYVYWAKCGGGLRNSGR